MRLQLIRTRAATVIHDHRQPIIIDHFPYILYDPAGLSREFGGSLGIHQCCKIDEIDGIFYVTADSLNNAIRINGCVVTRAALTSGDHLELKTTAFLVFYRQSNRCHPVPTNPSVGNEHGDFGNTAGEINSSANYSDGFPVSLRRGYH